MDDYAEGELKSMIHQLSVAGLRCLQIAPLQIPGIVPYDPWTENVLPIEVKVKVVRQVVQHFRELFSLRFEKAGSISFASDTYSRSSNSRDERCHSEFRIGPVVSNPFFRYIDGEPDYPSTDLHSPGSSSFNALHALRGPFSHAGDFLASSTRANLFKCETFPRETLAALGTVSKGGDEKDKPSEKEQTDRQRKSSQETPQETFERAKRIMKKGIELCDIYPGDACVWGEEISTPDRPFTLYWYDFRLANFLVSLRICFRLICPLMLCQDQPRDGDSQRLHRPRMRYHCTALGCC